jgi:hypothetical protein
VKLVNLSAKSLIKSTALASGFAFHEASGGGPRLLDGFAGRSRQAASRIQRSRAASSFSGTRVLATSAKSRGWRVARLSVAIMSANDGLTLCWYQGRSGKMSAAVPWPCSAYQSTTIE